MIDEYQIYEAKLIGADCILLIASVLSDEEITQFVNLAETLELDSIGQGNGTEAKSIAEFRHYCLDL